MNHKKNIPPPPVEFHVETLAQAVIRIKSNLRPRIDDLGDDLFPDGGPISKKLIEITGDSFTGKTLLIFEIIARCILPIEYGGKAANVIYLNLDHKFSIIHLINILEKNITSSSATNLTDISEICLKRLQIFNCYNMDDLMLTLMKIDKILFIDQNISAIIMDSISAFYWMYCEQKNMKMQSHYKELATKLKCLCMEYNICAIYTQPIYYADKQQMHCSLADYKFRLKLHNEFERIFHMHLNIGGNKFEKFYTIDSNGIKFPLNNSTDGNSEPQTKEEVASSR